jgi:PAS domain S-box-containing protein
MDDTQSTAASVRLAPPDPHDRQQIEEALRQSEERFRLLVQSVKDYAIFMLDTKGRVSSWNAGAERAKGYTADEIMGRYFGCFYTAEEVASGRPEELLHLAASQGRIEVEGWRVRKDGTRFWADVILTAIRDDAGQLLGFAKVTRDVTDRKQAEDALRLKQSEVNRLQKIETIGRLAGGIAHDFNNLLAGILGCAEEVLRESQKNPALAEEAANEITKACDRGRLLIRQLMAFSRRQIAAPRKIDLNEIIQNLRPLIHRSVGSPVKLELDLEPSLAPIEADVSQMEQVLMNLAINARDAMPAGGRLHIRTRNTIIDEFTVLEGFPDRPASVVQLTVSDSGTGIPPEIQSKIFEPFFTTKPHGKGTGLGLATVYGVVQQNKGGISVYSVPDMGTVFNIFLPAANSPEPNNDAQVPEGRGSASLQGTELVLVVDDDPLVLRTTVRSLQHRGYTVLSAGTVGEAKALFAKVRGKMRLLVTDIIMPDQNGKQLADAFLQADPSLKVLFMSGYEAETISAHGIVQGAVDLIEKPFSGEGLARRVREVLDRPPAS